MSQASFLTEQKNNILTLTFNSPQTHNALSESALNELHALFDELQTSPIRVVILKSKGKVFCSGHNLKEMTAHRQDDDKGEAYLTWLLNHCASMMMKLTQLPQVVIAQVEGIATAAGAQLVATADLAYATQKAQFCTPGVNLGGFCQTPSVALSRNLSNKHAMEMLLTGDMFGSENALRMGLINDVLEEELIDAYVLKLAEKIASKSQTAIRYGKKTYYAQSTLSLEEAYKHSAKVMVQNLLEKDAIEGINAFFEKREPLWG